MLLRVLLLSFASLATVHGGDAMAAQAESGFYAGGVFKPLVIDKDHVAVRGPSAGPRVSVLSDAEAARFLEMGVTIVQRGAVRDTTAIVGYPIWFNKEKEAVGVLTHEIVVRLAKPEAQKLVREAAGFADLRPMAGRSDVFLAKFSSPMAALLAANALYKGRDVVYAHPNFMVPKVWRAGPASKVVGVKRSDDEPFFQHQWHLENGGQFGGTAGADIHVRGAWEVTEGESDVLVAVLDGGFEISHPDLDGAWRRNAGEIPGNAVDDDGNGYVDDVLGWNFWADASHPSAGIIDDHGTAVSGLVAARKNGSGVVGTCPRCSLLPVTLSWEIAEDAAAFAYAASQGAAVITNSWGYPVGTPTTDVLEDAIAAAARDGRGGKGAIILFAMNNLNQDDCIGSEPDISSLDSVIAVSGASDLDKKVVSSAWGECMEYLSPTWEGGRPGIATTDLTGRSGYNSGTTSTDLPDAAYTNDFSGTSAATPISAGVFALMLTVNDGLSRNEALAMVLATADKVHPELAAYDPQTGFSKKYGYGRINAARAVRAAELFRKYTQRDRAPAADAKRAVRR